MQKIFNSLAPLAFAALLIFIILQKIDPASVFNVIKRGHPTALAASLFPFVIIILSLAQRWRALLAVCGYEIGYLRALKHYLASLPVSKISPSNSGDFIRALFFKGRLPASSGAGIVSLEMLLDFCVLALLALASALYLKNAPVIILCTVITALLLSCLLGIKKIRLRRFPSIDEKIQGFKKIFRLVMIRRAILTRIIPFSLISWILVVIFVYLAFRAIDQPIAITRIALLQPLVILFSQLPITVSGAGLREGSMLALYEGAATPEAITAVALLHTFVSIVMLPLIGLPFLFSVLRKSKNYGNLQ